MSTIDRVCLLGFGEVGQILADDLPQAGVTALAAWDIKFPDADSIPSRGLAGRRVTPGADAPHAADGADLVISAVTADQTLEAALAAAPGLKPGSFYLDMNSASPATKIAAARRVEEAGGRYVEAAVMSPVPAKRRATPMLLGGPHAEAFLPAAGALGMAGATVYSDRLGKASAAKMCRSVMVKGVEALLAEAVLAARHYGVEDTVLDSLNDLFPGPDWSRLSRYMISRSVEHGVRRAEEMREAARTVEEAGVDPLMTAACATRQQWAADNADAFDIAETKT